MSGVWIFDKKGVARLITNPTRESFELMQPTYPGSGTATAPGARPKVLVYLPENQVISSYVDLEKILIELGWSHYNNPISLCQAQDESRNHLLAGCEYSKRLWEKTMQWLQQQCYKHTQWSHHLEWAIKSAKRRSLQAQIFRMAYAECLYAIWMERNHRIF
ncbi:flowering-promoting factor 1-like protein 3 isoform X2 [Nicotiana sylvestris]|uniref:Flowering-promoting factor 1-like protein 3 isoform X2 n=1 Tax=Nicotiana sylvestris TaxID=4096 RepID=A0A1U7V830_NICSY|nr:PREDICTED: flowering-promoting factor 1-like protein 3 isoform X2 [Nicotiana sylvestris]